MNNFLGDTFIGSSLKSLSIIISTTFCSFIVYLFVDYLPKSGDSMFVSEGRLFQAPGEISSYYNVLTSIFIAFLIYSFCCYRFLKTKKFIYLLAPFAYYLIPALFSFGWGPIYYIGLVLPTLTPIIFMTLIVCFIINYLMENFRFIGVGLQFLIIVGGLFLVSHDSMAVNNLKFNSYDSIPRFAISEQITNTRTAVIKNMFSDSLLGGNNIDIKNELSSQFNFCEEFWLPLVRSECKVILENQVEASIRDLTLFIEGVNKSKSAISKVEDIKIGNGETLNVFSPYKACINHQNEHVIENYVSSQNALETSYAYDKLWVPLAMQNMKVGGIRKVTINSEVYTLSVADENAPYGVTCKQE